MVAEPPKRRTAGSGSDVRDAHADMGAVSDATPPGPVEETKRKVIVATIGLIERHTYGAVTVDAVARASGVSKSTIYRHWPSRQVLVLEAFTHKTDLLTDVPDSGDALADLRTYLAKLAYCLDFGGAASIVSGLIGDAIRDDDFSQLFRSTMVRGRRRTFTRILLLGQRRGQIRSDVDVAIAVDALYGAIHHRLLITRQPIDGPFVDGLATFAADCLRVERDGV